LTVYRQVEMAKPVQAGCWGAIHHPWPSQPDDPSSGNQAAAQLLNALRDIGLWSAVGSAASTALSTGLTYQGRPTNDGGLTNGDYDL
jgi:hypothetical protein